MDRRTPAVCIRHPLLPTLFSSLMIGCVIPLSTGPGGDAGADGADGAADSIPPDVFIPPGSWTNVTSNLTGIASTCGPVSALSAKPDEDLLIAGIAQAGLYASRDGGGTWRP